MTTIYRLLLVLGSITQEMLRDAARISSLHSHTGSQQEYDMYIYTDCYWEDVISPNRITQTDW